MSSRSPARLVTTAIALLLALFAIWWRQRQPELRFDAPVLLLGALFLLFAAWRWPEDGAADPAPHRDADDAAHNGPPRPDNAATSTSRAVGATQLALPWHDDPALQHAVAPRDHETPTAPVVVTPWDSPLPAAPQSSEGPWLRFSLKDVPEWRIAAFFVSLLYIGGTLWYLATTPTNGTFNWAIILWLGAIAVFLLAVAPPIKRPRISWRIWWEINRWPVLLLIAIFAVALLLRTTHLELLPHTLGGDEASQGLEAVKVINGEIRNPFSTGWLNVPTLSFFYNSLSIRLMGETVTALRLPWAILGAVTVMLVFWLVTRLRGIMLGFVTAGLLALFHYHIHFSRLGSNQIADPFFMVLMLLFLYRARDRNSPLDWALAGVVTGVAQFSYAGARLTVVVLFATILFFLLTNLKRRALFRDLVGGALNSTAAFLITAAPMIQYAIRFPNEYNARLNQVGLIQSGLLDRMAASPAFGSRWAVIWYQFKQSALAFNIYPDRSSWYGLSQPLMDEWWAPLFMLGLLYCTVRVLMPRVDNRLFPMVIWFWAGILLGGVLTDSAPSSQRLITLAVPATFFIAVLLQRLWQFILDALDLRNRRLLASALLFSVLALGLTSVHGYFTDYSALRCTTAPTCYGGANGEIATEVGRYLADRMDNDEQAVMVGAPQLFASFSTIPYLAPQTRANMLDAPEAVLTTPPPADWLPLDPDKTPLFIVTHHRSPELPHIEAAFPGGTATPITDRYGRLLATIYDPTP
ncbi:MAG: glycosyltransferase family 39 protein [Anaerolineales bacterium]|nr:glycosyltransferase family 39 protein [Anaerolineales bacterium]MCB9127022.1 glycosyltransferase family 39 protein [Ardenticatenales bacterium]